MNIGMVTDTYFPRVNGVAKSTATFAREFRQMGHQVTIFAPRFSGHQETDPGIWRFPSHYLFFNPEDRLANPWLPRSRKMLKQATDLKLDILHTQTPFALGTAMVNWARRRGLPAVHTYHTLFEAYMPHYFPIFPRKFSQYLVNSVSRNFCNKHNAVVVPSSSIAEKLKEYGVTVPVAIIPTGIDLSPFQNLDGPRMRKKLGFSDDENLLLTMGRVAGEKNIPFLFDVLEILLPRQPRSRLVIAGSGPALESVKAECGRRRLESKVVFIGLLDRRDWADLYAAADLHLLASVTETQGLVLTEAMAAGTPCVAVNAMGVRDVMAGGGGLAVSPDVKEFADAVNRLLSDEKLYAAKVAEAKAQAQNWSARAKAGEMIKLYEKLIAENRQLRNHG